MLYEVITKLLNLVDHLKISGIFKRVQILSFKRNIQRAHPCQIRFYHIKSSADRTALFEELNQIVLYPKLR